MSLEQAAESVKNTWGTTAEGIPFPGIMARLLSWSLKVESDRRNYMSCFDYVVLCLMNPAMGSNQWDIGLVKELYQNSPIDPKTGLPHTLDLRVFAALRHELHKAQQPPKEQIVSQDRRLKPGHILLGWLTEESCKLGAGDPDATPRHVAVCISENEVLQINVNPNDKIHSMSLSDVRKIPEYEAYSMIPPPSPPPPRILSANFGNWART